MIQLLTLNAGTSFTRNRLITLWLRLAALTIAISLSGCTGLNKRPGSDPRNTAVGLLDSYWHVDGKLAIQIATPADNTNHTAYTLHLDWQQQGEDYTITLTGPLGFGRIKIERHAQYSRLTQGNIHIKARSVDQLFAQQTGWTLPISSLRYWMLGIPVPNTPSTPIHPHTEENMAKSPLADFRQNDWDISYASTQMAGSYMLPTKMTATHANFKLVIAFKHWQLLPSNTE